MKKKSLLFLLALFVLPFSAKAASMEIACDKTTAEPNAEVHCTIKAYDTQVSGAEGVPTITNGTIVSATSCGVGGGLEDARGAKEGDNKPKELSCIQDIKDTQLDVITYTIKVGTSGTTTFTIASPKVIGNNYETYPVTVEAANITIASGASDPTPSDPTPTPSDPTPSDPTPSDPTPSNPTPSEDPKPSTPTDSKSGKKDKIENPNTGTFLDVTLIVLALAGASYVVYNVAKKKIFFRL